MINIEQTIRNGEQIELNIKKEINYITSFISYQKYLKNYISNNFDIISLNDNLQNNFSNEIGNFFKRVYESRLSLDCNIINLRKLFTDLKKLEKQKGISLSNNISDYNKSYRNYFKDIDLKTNNSKQLADDLHSFLISKQKELKKANISDVPNFNLESQFDNPTLKISEKTGKVYLPYFENELNKIMEENPNTFSCKKDIVNKKFVIPLSYYKNSSLARFKEAYKLVREKENGSISEALNLGVELFFNYNLDPAIISACKNIDELDIYLDCLEDNEIDDFYCFNIIYEVAPIKKD